MVGKSGKDEKHSQPSRGAGSPKNPSRPVVVRTPSGSGKPYLDLSYKGFPPQDKNLLSPGRTSSLQIGVFELLEQDERPTFIIDTGDPSHAEHGPLKILFANAALKSRNELSDQVFGYGSNGENVTRTSAFLEFKKWVASPFGEQRKKDQSYANVVWTASLISSKFGVFKGYRSNGPFTPRAHPAVSTALTPGLSSNKENANRISVGSPGKDVQDYFGMVSYSSEKHKRVKSSEKLQRPKTDSLKEKKTADSRDTISPSSGPEVLRAPLTGQITQDTTISQAVDSIGQMSVSDECFDWTRVPASSPGLSSHIQFIKSIDWSKTSLGPMETWQDELRGAVNLIMACPFPAAMYWGDKYTTLYNQAYVEIAGPKHPQLMGMDYEKAWAEIWHLIKGPVELAYKSGIPTVKDDDMLLISRFGNALEETYFDWGLIPLLKNDGSIGGLYNPAFEQTRRKVFERRFMALQEIGNQTANVQDQKAFWKQLIKGLSSNSLDSPFALLYSVLDDIDSDSPQSSIHSGTGGHKHCCLEGVMGITSSHPVSVSSFELQSGHEYLAMVFRDAMRKDTPTYLSIEDGTLDPTLVKDVKDYGIDAPCTAAVCCPIFLPNVKQPLGFLLLGLNPRRPYDHDYQLYLQLLNRQLTTTIASVILFEEEIAKGKRAAQAAAKETTALSEQLKQKVEQVAVNEAKIALLTELNPAAMFVADTDGNLTYCNETWYQTMTTGEERVESGEWMSSIVDEDRGRFAGLWKDLVKQGKNLDAEIRLKSVWTHNGKEGETWVLAKAIMRDDPKSSVRGIYGCITNISQQKWAEHQEKLVSQEAVHRKAEQEAFIDMTSHEMRNPLSSILQCADEIARTAAEILEASDLPANLVEVMKTFLTVANTLSVCGHHEKRIVDDILTLSKLDAGKLQVTPKACNPRELIKQAQTMFIFDLKWNKIELQVCIDESIDKLGITWVNVDPSRVLAVLVNLTTNSIKFTAKEEKRQINLTLSATLTPSASHGSVTFVPISEEREDPTIGQEWGNGEVVYIHYAVTDTGRGLTKPEMSNLFRRFSQASSHTHVNYGGSGLGLFIARLLSEIQGGQIGVASTPGVGSTFSFYVKARRTNPPSTSPRKPLTSKRDGKGGLNIMLVEDNEINAATAARNLRKSGCVVHLASHGGECLELMRKSHVWKDASIGANELIDVDAILMDQEMPVMDGLTCAREIRKMEKEGLLKSHVPIIAITANARAEQIGQVLEAGMVSVLVLTGFLNFN